MGKLNEVTRVVYGANKTIKCRFLHKMGKFRSEHSGEMDGGGSPSPLDTICSIIVVRPGSELLLGGRLRKRM